MHRNTPSLAAALLMSVALGSTPVLGLAQDAAAGIAETNEAFEQAVAAGDVDALAALYTPNAMLMAPNAPVAQGQDAIRSAFEGMLAEVGTLDLTSNEIEAFGDTAFEVGGYVLEGPDGAHLDHGKYIVIWKRTPDGWKLHRDIFNSDMAMAEGH